MKILKELFGNKQLEEELDDFRGKCDFLKNELARILTNNEFLQEELKNYESLKERVQIKDREIKNLKLENENQKDELIKCKIFQRELDNEIISLKESNEKEKSKKEQLLEELTLLQQEKQNLTYKLQKNEILELKYGELKLALKDLEKKYSEEKIEKVRLVEEISKKAEKEESLEKEITNLERELGILRKKSKEEKVTKEQLLKETVTLYGEKQKLIYELQKKEMLELKYGELELAVEDLEKKYNEEKIEKVKLVEEISKKVGKEESLENEITNLERELDILRKKSKEEKVTKEQLLKETVTLYGEKQKLIYKLQKKETLEKKTTEELLKIQEEKINLEEELSDLRKVNEIQKEKKENLSKEISLLCEKKKELEKELLKKEGLELRCQKLEEKIEKIEEKTTNKLLNTQAKIDINLIEKSSTWSCTDYNEYLKNKNRLSEYLFTFTENDFKKIYSLGKEKNIFNTFDERQILTVITWLKWGTPLSKLNTDKINELYVKFIEEYHKTSVIKVDEIKIRKEETLEKIKIDSKETEIQEEKKELILVTKWSDYEKYLENKNDLLPLLRTFTECDFKEIYIEGKKRKILKPSQERDFSNIMTRLKLKLPLTDMSLEKIELFYGKLIEDIHIDKVQKLDKSLDKKINEIPLEVNLLEEELTFDDLENYSANDWYELYELSKKDRNISEWLRKKIFNLGKYVENNLEINKSQYQVIKNNYSELYPLIKKIDDNKKELNIKNLKVIETKEIQDNDLKIELDKDIIQILF